VAKRLDRSSDVPDFDAYPANPPKDKGFLRTDSSNGLEERARQVGNAMGKAVVAMRKTQERMKDIANQTGEAAASRITHVKNMAEETASRVGNISETMKAKAQEWTETATARADEFCHATVERVSEVGSQIKNGYYRTRLRANQVVREYPLQIVLIAGAIGFLLGVGLRIWRMNREY
jgi:ElaB/YqjD/DUF883 family membrane-anchored ribosome-binding protein